MSRPAGRARVTIPTRLALPAIVAVVMLTAVAHLRHPAPLNGATLALIVFTIAAVVAADRKVVA